MKQKKLILFIVFFLLMFFNINKLEAVEKYNVACNYTFKKDNINLTVQIIIQDFDGSDGKILRYYMASDGNWKKTDYNTAVGDYKGVNADLPKLQIAVDNVFLFRYRESDKCPTMYLDDLDKDPFKVRVHPTNISRSDYYFSTESDGHFLSNDEIEWLPKDRFFAEVERIKNEGSSGNETFNPVIPGETLSCTQIIGENGRSLVELLILIIRIITPTLLFIFTAYEFMKAVPQQDPDSIKKAWKRFGSRGIIAAIIMLLPTFINLLGVLFNFFDSCDIW